MRLASLVVLVGVFAVAVPRAEAGPIATRATLDALLGSGAINEDFETYTIASDYALLGGTLNSTTVANGQGPGLVVDGMTLSTTSGDIIWQANDFFSLPTKTIGANVTTNLTVNFTIFANAFGVDLLNYFGNPATNTVTVYGLDDTTVIGVSGGITFGSGVTPQFFGFEDASGIGGFRVDTIQGFGPVIDNVEFGATVPEPASLMLLGSGLVAVARRVHRRRGATTQVE